MRAAHAYFGDWEEGLFAWELAAPRRLATPLAWRGSLGWLDVPDSALAAP
jgi:hypothetical protein